ncbi:MAG: cation diffusion facilitator family transporter [Archaeoglobus sp.]|jgi:cation diffusion facilitator family transporter|nr:MAG: cation diffusion facilitator family transporter [Archaeoglobus sp.]
MDNTGVDEAVKAGKVSVLANIVLTIVKGVAGIAANSTALIADSLHSMIDILSSALVWIGIKIAEKPPDRDHPYGHFKAESLAELGVGTVIIATAILIIYDAVNELISGRFPEFEYYALAAALFSAIVNEGLARYKIDVGMRTKSTSLIAEGKHSRTDVVASLAVVLGFILIYLGYWWADAVVAIAISILIMQVGGEILKNAVDVLMDRVDVETTLRIVNYVESIRGIESVNFVGVRGTWRNKIVEVHFTVSPGIGLEEVEKITKRVEDLKKEIPDVRDVIPVVKFSKKINRVAIPVNEEGEFTGDLNAKYFEIVDLRNGIKRKVVNEYSNAERRKGYLIAEMLKNFGVDCIVLSKVGEGAKSHFKSVGINVKIVNAKRKIDVLKEIAKIRSQ